MTATALAVRNISKSFAGVQAVCDVSFDVQEGSLTALIGPNGAGKTTLFNVVTQLYKPDAGRVELFGATTEGRSSSEIAAMGMVRTFQTARTFPTMTVLENVLVGHHLRLHSGAWGQMLWLGGARREERELRRKGEALLEIVGLATFCNRPASDLPMGAQKLLEVARAMMARPRVLLLDEPAAGLNDAETEELATLLKAITSTGVTVLVVEHNMSLVMSVADQIVALEAGSVIAAGSPQAVRNDPRVIEAYIGRALEEAHA
ncbi:ABC transporter ATP-binding protein [Pusillimonas sp.]|uniref:ABC transporter ATP-binding protein n=1 Tax=Pusillimonas sp. TaxID=3040095 RepID=UPI0029A08FA4|nr:ABC transporter ATP-binding protein [Pusillimonas sp.]MDX3894018.1 ABC transporter ATP-binding protein [Pusillimonas sp.]